MKVAIVNDSKMAVEVLRRIVEKAAGFDLAWVAYSGEDAVRMAAENRPEIILMDLIMPGVSGAEATRRIMKATPCVILVVTATTTGNRDQVFEAMGNGALDAINTPTLGADGNISNAEPLLQKLRTVSRLVSPASHAHAPSTVKRSSLPRAASETPIVAIGASTGGPQALSQILSTLPAHFPAAVLVAQHVDEQFAPGLVKWLQHHSALPVHLAHEGDAISAGAVWIAGTADHMYYDDASGTLHYTAEPRERAYRPSVDVLFESLAHPHQAPRIGVLLTGMGKDGAEGLLTLRKAGCLTIAQDAESSVVYGMPKAAAERASAQEILPLDEIGPRIRHAIAATTPTTRGAS